MTETASAAAKGNTPKHSPPLGVPKNEILGFDPSKIDMPAAFHELAQQGAAQARDNYQKIQAAADEMTSVIEQTYSTAAKGVADYNLKVIGIARANGDAAFEFACRLVALKSLPEMVELSTDHARKQLERVTGQNQELWALAQRMATECTAPIKQSVTKSFGKIG